MEKWKEFFENNDTKHIQKNGREINEIRVVMSRKLIEDDWEGVYDDPEEFHNLIIACTNRCPGHEEEDEVVRALQTMALIKLIVWSIKRFPKATEQGHDSLLKHTMDFMHASITRENIVEFTSNKN